ncbi:ubl carboxyl-terminal hydrolase 18 isoform X2 [Periophthalmus magnuspinnatus]|uniref:ubl carboxyl-terminal hydrolase 18 isoform X2 n=1 Tax=Periophthalmus magnuspinnatus TaxID=409849 RepID=UPI00145A254F|nr:ubl carboxyl-terminal hydrolase 18 isoform X2 [Periophthalmus magnuspinnatus]
MAARFLCRNFYSRSFLGIRGLPNYCLSCCVNTLLQTLSATWELVELLDRWDTAHLKGNDGCNVPLELKKFLVAMQSAEHVSHRDFLHCLDQNGVQLHIQHDADEVFLFILNLIQKQTDDKILAEQIQTLYKISVETHVQCLQCDSIQTKENYLLTLPLHVKEDHTSLEQCLTSFFEEHELRGINCCFCVQCAVKTPSKQGVQLLSLPPILCIQLKRYRNNGRFTQKLGYEVTFPETFDLSTTVPHAFSKDFNQPCKYTLYAVVVHSGSAGFGHYTAYVRHRDTQSWYFADDSHTHQVSWNKVQTSYGGEHRHTAYMLMYRRTQEDNKHKTEIKCNEGTPK